MDRHSSKQQALKRQTMLDKAVERDLLDFVYSNALNSVIAALVNSLLILWVLWGEVDHSGLFAWFGANLLITLLRFLISEKYAAASGYSLDVRRRAFLFNTFIGAISWAALVLFFKQIDASYQAMIGFIICGITAAAVYVLGAVPKALYLFASVVFLTLAIGFFLFAGKAGVVMGSLSLFFWVMMFRIERLYYDSLLSSFNLKHENAKLVYVLKEEKSKAEIASSAKSKFLANMSHEIRTPMNGVIGSLSLLDQTETTAEQKALLNASIHSAEHLLQLLSDILDLSKIEADKLELEEKPYDLELLVKQVYQLFEALAESKKLLFVLEIGTDIPDYLLGDAVRLKQVLCNLVSNAIKFTDHGEVSITLSAQHLGYNEYHIACEVKDSGIGISEADQARLFSAFSQAGSSKTSVGGTGLGLAISKQLVERMGGELTLSSKQGEGAVFCVQWLAQEADNYSVNTLEPAQAELSGKLLLVEDNAINQMITQTILNNMGVEVDLADHGEQALDQLKSHQYDAVLMDCQMPIMDGYEASRRWRAYEAEHQLPRTPILALTAHAMKGDREACERFGMDNYMVKPVKQEVLYKALKPYLNKPSRQNNMPNAAE
jgi:signal transduction histidine kinase/CheY-like chemotaxis protein